MNDARRCRIRPTDEHPAWRDIQPPTFEEFTMSDTTQTKRRRGFAAMNPEQQRKIASQGGRAAHASGHAHEFTTEEASAAGRKRHEKRRASGSELRPQ
jgi:hypothetical protein